MLALVACSQQSINLSMCWIKKMDSYKSVEGISTCFHALKMQPCSLKCQNPWSVLFMNLLQMGSQPKGLQITAAFSMWVRYIINPSQEIHLLQQPSLKTHTSIVSPLFNRPQQITEQWVQRSEYNCNRGVQMLNDLNLLKRSSQFCPILHKEQDKILLVLR